MFRSISLVILYLTLSTNTYANDVWDSKLKLAMDDNTWVQVTDNNQVRFIVGNIKCQPKERTYIQFDHIGWLTEVVCLNKWTAAYTPINRTAQRRIIGALKFKKYIIDVEVHGRVFRLSNRGFLTEYTARMVK